MRGAVTDRRPGFVPGLLLLFVPVVACLVLVLEALTDLPMPGCGEDGGCAAAAASAWGRLPGLGWPVSHLGLAWFGMLLESWWFTGGRFVGPLRWLLRLGGVASLVWSGAMIANGWFCPFCAAAHAANLLFLVLVETGKLGGLPANVRPPKQSLVRAFASFASLTVILAVFQWSHDRRVAERDAEELAQSTAAVKEASHAAGAGGDGPPPLTGRHRLGPEVAPLRLVVFADYQCPDCRTLDGELQRLVESRSDLSLSVRHFPQCRDCNRRFRASGKNPHKNACWAARAAEAAGRVGGTDAFWAMHRWLFAREGAFDERILDGGLAELDLPRDEFLKVMKGRATLGEVERDIEQALALGIRGTPFVFLNGVEFRGWQVPGALTRAVEEVAATNPPARGPEADRPPRGLAKSVADWRAEPRRTLPPDLVEWSLAGGGTSTTSGAPDADGAGSAGAVVTVTLFGDYREPSTPELDRRLRAAVAARPDTRYVFRHYPFDGGCNPHYPKVAFGGSCLSARVAEAAGIVGGADGFWALHDALMARPVGPGSTAPTEPELLELARGLGLDADALASALATGAADAAVRDDCEAGKRLALPSIPALYIDGQLVPRWKEGDGVPEHLLDLARADAGG